MLLSSAGDEPGSPSLSNGVLVTPQLAISSSLGGSVIVPGEGDFDYDEATWVTVNATPVDPCLFMFSGWSGRAIAEGKVEDPNALVTPWCLLMVFTIFKQTLSSTQSTLYVDADVPTSLEYGTLANPFSSIQGAVDVSMAGGEIHIASGNYYEAVGH